MSPREGIDRRRFLQGVAAAGGLAAVGPAARAGDLASWNQSRRPDNGRHDPNIPINHVVVAMMENRSVDHYLGWRAAEDEHFDARDDWTFTGPDSVTHSTSYWGEGAGGEGEMAGCGYEDPGHGWEAGRVQLGDAIPKPLAEWCDPAHPDCDQPEPNGWQLEGSRNDRYALSYYGPDDLPVTAALTRNFVTCDRFFCSVLTSTYPNREYLHSAQSGGIHNNDFPPERGYDDGFSWPTIWTQLDQAGVSWAYYYSNLPVIGLWGLRHFHGARHISQFYADALAGQLPQVSFVDPWFVAPHSLNNDDHPHADVRLGQEFISDVTAAVMTSPHWTDPENSIALVITYDEWGGFFDHVTPPIVDDPRNGHELGAFGQLGFRVPTHVVSPYTATPGGRTAHDVYDHVSILAFIQDLFGLGSLQALDAMARDASDRSMTPILRGKRFRPDAPEIADALLAYVAPLEARVPCELRGHTPPVSDLHRLEEDGWFERFGFRTDYRFEDGERISRPVPAAP